MRAFRATAVALLVIACALASCDSQPEFPNLRVPPGDFGDVRGAWEGRQVILGQERRVVLFLDQVGEQLVGRADGSRSRRRAREGECPFIMAFRDGRWDAFGVSIAYDATTDTLTANLALSGIFDPSARFTLTRFDWFSVGDDEDDVDRVSQAQVVCGLRPAPQCANGVDDDGDGSRDRLDPACCLGGGCRYSGNNESLPSSCADGLDNDHDGRVDDDDPKCTLSDPLEDPPQEWLCANEECEPPEDSCDNGEDDNGNGLIDDDDPGCALLGRETRHFCLDGIDNDGDGLMDLEEEDCVLVSNSGERGFGLLAPLLPGELGTCLDGIDNDDDGSVDGDDRQCRFSLRGNEMFATLQRQLDEPLGNCANGIDDDGDGLSDDDDPGCSHVLFSPRQGALALPRVTFFNGRTVAYESIPVRYEGAPPCANLEDDDGDGLVDLEDPGCRFPLDWSEGTSCDNDEDDDGDGDVDGDDSDCARGLGDEVSTRCANGVDDDGDGLVDLDDPGCTNAADTSELGSCEDGLDNDGDALIDSADPSCVDRSASEVAT